MTLLVTVYARRPRDTSTSNNDTECLLYLSNMLSTKVRREGSFVHHSITCTQCPELRM